MIERKGEWNKRRLIMDGVFKLVVSAAIILGSVQQTQQDPAALCLDQLDGKCVKTP